MLGRWVEQFFFWIYRYLKVSCFFWGMSLAGGLVLGMAPASASLMSLLAEHGRDYKAYRWSQAWALFKENFKRSNQIFYSFVVWFGLLAYGLFLLLQLPASAGIVVLTMINAVLLFLPILMYLIWLKLQVYFELSYLAGLKLSLIGVFSSLGAIVRLLVGSVCLLLASRYLPALAFFLFVGIWHGFLGDCLESVYQLLRKQLVPND